MIVEDNRRRGGEGHSGRIVLTTRKELLAGNGESVETWPDFAGLAPRAGGARKAKGMHSGGTDIDAEPAFAALIPGVSAAAAAGLQDKRSPPERSGRAEGKGQRQYRRDPHAAGDRGRKPRDAGCRKARVGINAV